MRDGVGSGERGTERPQHGSGIAGASGSSPDHVRHRRLHRALAVLLLTAVCGCTSGLMSMPGSGLFGKLPDLRGKKTAARVVKDDEDNDFGDHIETPLLSEYISVQGNNLVVLRGVGLVTGLDGTGDNPPPSSLRVALKEEMTRRGVAKPEQILASRNTALVVVTAYLPALVHKGQRFDVRVSVPPNSDATSLKGGWLLETRLFEEQAVEGHGSLRGHEYGIAYGAVMTALGVEKTRSEISGELRRGSIPGGAVSRTDRDLSIVLKNDKRGYRNSQRISAAVSQRFHHYNRFGQRVSLAEPKTDALIELKMHPTYRNNFPRYQQVIRSIAFNESDVARRVRMESLEREILESATAQKAALQLEAIGETSIPFLKRAMQSSEPEVRFHSAQALAYMGDPSGVEILKEAVEQQPALRVYALAALSVVEAAEAVMTLRSLMSAPDLETRYGALRALQENAPNDQALVRAEFENRFVLFLIDSSGPPMAHVTRRRAPEVVLFGTEQRLKLPAVLNAGRHISVIGEDGRHEVVVTRYDLNQSEPIRRTVSCRLADVLRTCGELGATYPDVVQLLIEAEQQQNLPGDFGIDRLPQAGRILVNIPGGADATAAKDVPAPDESLSEDSGGKIVGNPAMIPNLFDRLEEDELRKHETDEKLSSLKFSDVTDADEPSDKDEPSSEVQDPSQRGSSAKSRRSSAKTRAGRVQSSSDEPATDNLVKTADQPANQVGDASAAGAISSPKSDSNEGSADEGTEDQATEDQDDESEDEASGDEASGDEASDTRPGPGQRFRKFLSNPLGRR